MRKIPIILSGVAVAVLFAAGVFLVAGGFKMKGNIQIRTDTQPIYNHFPGLPETSEIQWCSRSSDGIGLTTVQIYIFAFYSHDISNELQDMGIENQSRDIELYFDPDGINGDQKWRCIENAKFAFQTDIKDTQKMNTTVYINDSGTILYIEAIGD